jgi:trans-aconitate methyltransferase
MRDIGAWDEKFKDLPFERIQERYREIKSLEVLSRVTSGKVPTRILEVGPGLSSICPDFFPTQYVVLIEPAGTLFDYNKEKFFSSPNVTVLKKTIIEFTLEPNPSDFDLIVMNGVLHELDDPQAELKTLMKSMKPQGQLVVSVPNNQSIHRLMGVALGILPSPESSTKTEISLQQSHNFSPRTLTDLLADLGLRVKLLETSFVKPHTHLKMQEWVDQGVLEDSDLDTLFKFSRIFDPFGSEIFVVAEPFNPNAWLQ